MHDSIRTQLDMTAQLEFMFDALHLYAQAFLIVVGIITGCFIAFIILFAAAEQFLYREETTKSSDTPISPDALSNLMPHQTRLNVGLILVLIGLPACAPSRILHSDGRPVAAEAEMIKLDNGWIVLDYCDTGAHAVVQLYIETEAPIMGPSLPLSLQLPNALTYFKTDGPFCRPNLAFDKGLGNRSFESYPGETHRCLFSIRAEYALDRLVPYRADAFLALLGLP